MVARPRATVYSQSAGRAALTTSAAGHFAARQPAARDADGVDVSSNVAQSYPYTTETAEQRASAVARATEQFDGLAAKIATEADPLPDAGPDQPGQPHRFWVFVCPRDDFAGRLHVAGYARERHALYIVCDTCGEAFLR